MASEGQGAPRSRQFGAAEGSPRTGSRRHRRHSLAASRVTTDRRPASNRMLRLLHTADVHLGARHADLGEAATAQRERQFAAFKAAVDLAIEEKVDLFLVAGDLFDSNTQPRRSVERVAAELARLGKARIRTVVVPARTTATTARRSTGPTTSRRWPAARPTTTWSRSSRRTRQRSGSRPSTRRSMPRSSPRSAPRTARSATSTSTRPRTRRPRPTWHIGMVHGALAIPDRTDRDEVVVTKEEIAATGLDYLALGHWHSSQKGKAGATTYAYSGAPEPVAVDQDGRRQRPAGHDRGGRPASARCKVEERRSADALRAARDRRSPPQGPAGPDREASGEGQSATSSSRPA